ncbi:heparan-alpha-glucosaminide N-acetyltransferase domain-containing protein [Brevibacterium spongiae]|uniref:Heparan-alpha-glucosaminide N-acetyltransferase domain-containing protein n=1 Tax=Brevibacterium spongiae TaxID=2909672 RepID=A0ABY5SRB6_9MICO|nr:heparan-alpha-glucosaminide N-acetyltransferase domain-containing protein [Brevibacterium spongiae]UVI36850.1 heparan-alpha-glucosaminide N-acetyltransferase domain-containing protein [Brevibacterium spongiae]
MTETTHPNPDIAEAVASRPAPGPRRPREIWTGRSEVWLSEISSDPAEPMRNVAGGGLRTSSQMLNRVVDRDRRRRRARSVGVDAARGFALIGMFAVHLLPAAHSDGSPTLVWQILAGNAAALFAVLAGVSLAFGSGGERPVTGRPLHRSRVNVAVRGLLLIVLGFGLNRLNLAAFDILPYFGIMFLLAIPFLPLRARTLLVTGTVLVVTMPVTRYLLHQQVEGLHRHPAATFDTALTDPLGVTATLLVTGTYPVLTWFALVCLGMGIGRLQLHFTTPRMLIIVIGAFAVLIATAVTKLLVNRFDGYASVQRSLPGSGPDAVDDFIVFGPTGPLPTAAPGWLLVGGPHTNTSFALIIGAGFSLVTIGLLILLARGSNLLRPLVDMGRMPMTLYTTHLLIITVAPDDVGEVRLFFIQSLAAFGFACLWRMFFKRGPLEAVMTAIARSAAKMLGLSSAAGPSVTRSS